MTPVIGQGGRRTTQLLRLITLGLALAAGWRTVIWFRQSRQLEALRAEQSNLTTENARLQAASDRSHSLLAATLEELNALVTDPSAPSSADSELTAWLERVHRLQDWFRAAPDKAIPEMSFLNSNDWLAATLDNPLNSDAAFRTAASQLRRMAKLKPEIATNFRNAIIAYASAHDGEPPPDSMALVPYLKTALPSEILQRYEPVPENAGQTDGNEVFLRGTRFTGAGRGVLWEKTPVDEDYDSLLAFTKAGAVASQEVSKLGDAVGEATRAFRKANPGRTPASAHELLPYFPEPVDATKLREYWEMQNRP